MTLDEDIAATLERLRRSTNKRAGYALRSLRKAIRKDAEAFDNALRRDRIQTGTISAEKIVAWGQLYAGGHQDSGA